MKERSGDDKLAGLMVVSALDALGAGVLCRFRWRRTAFGVRHQWACGRTAGAVREEAAGRGFPARPGKINKGLS